MPSYILTCVQQDPEAEVVVQAQQQEAAVNPPDAERRQKNKM
jgi:hypothetical protein